MRNKNLILILCLIFALAGTVKSQNLILKGDSYLLNGVMVDSSAALIFNNWEVLTMEIGSMTINEFYDRVDMRKIGRRDFTWDIVVNGDIIDSVFVDQFNACHLTIGNDSYVLLNLVELSRKQIKNYNFSK